MNLPGQWVDRVHRHKPIHTLILDLDSSISPTHGHQEGSAYNGHFACSCYPPLFCVNQYGDVERALLQTGNVHSADDWRSVLEPVVARYRDKAIRKFFRGDAAFAQPGVYEFLEAERYGYAIRLPPNARLYRRVKNLVESPPDPPWDPSQKKVDCDSALASGKTGKDFEAVFASAVAPLEYLRAAPVVTGLMDEARTVLTARMAGYLLRGSYRLVLPTGPGNGSGGVALARDNHGAEDNTTITRAPLWLPGLGESVETKKQYLELAYTYPKDGRIDLRTSLVERQQAKDNQQLKKLAAEGMPVDSSNGSKVVSYLSALESRIGPFLPTTRLTPRNGWHQVEGVRQFVLGEHTVADPSGGSSAARVQLHTDEGDLCALIEAMRPAGTLDGWRDLADRVSEHSGYGRFLVSASFTAPLVHVLGMRSTMVHLYGQTQSGKTAGMYLAASVWARPRDYITTHNATSTSVEYQAAFLSDLTTCLDELQLAQNERLREVLVYMSSGGVGRGRAKKDGGLQETARWKGVCVSSGEERITADADLGGQASRVVELRIPIGSAVVDAELAGHLYRLRDHGHAGKLFIERLIAADWDYLREQHKRLATDLAHMLPNLSGSVVHALGSVALADACADEWVFGRDAGDDATYGHASLDLIRSLYDEQDVASSFADRALEWTRSWLISSRAHFETEKGMGNALDPLLGRIAANGDVYLLTSAWKDAMKRAGYIPNRVVADWRDREWIEVEIDAHGKKRHPRKKIGERYDRVIVLRAAALDRD